MSNYIFKEKYYQGGMFKDETVAILIEKFFDEKELIYPYIRLLEEGYEVHLVGTEKTQYIPEKHFHRKEHPCSK